MVSNVGGLLTGSQTGVLLSIKKTQKLVDKVQLALASGNEVNSAVDDPQSYFMSKGLSFRAQDLSKLLDGISLSLKRVQETDNGITAISNVLDQAQALLNDASMVLPTAFDDKEIAAIIAANPGVSYNPATDSFYKPVATTATWTNANANAQSTTLVQPTGMKGIEGVGGHLAVITSAQENTFVNNLIGADSWLGGTDQEVEGQWRWVGGTVDGEQFWQGLSGGSAVNGFYSNWNTGEPNQSGNEDYLEMYFAGGGIWNDLSNGSLLSSVVEWDARTLLPGTDEDAAKSAAYEVQYQGILDQIDEIAKDSSYLGVNLLTGNDMTTSFNPTGSTNLVVKGTDATSAGLGLTGYKLASQDGVQQSIKNVLAAKDHLRSYSSSLAVDFSIISNRLDFTQNDINVNKNAAEGLIIADPNEKGAELLALQVRQQMQFQVLALTSKNNLADLLF